MRKTCRTASSVLVLAAAGLGCSGTSAGDYGLQSFPGDYAAVPVTVPDDTVRLRASIGAMYLEGNEFVFAGNYTVSHLIWKTNAPVLRGSISVDVGGGLSVAAEGSIAAFGDSNMEDYDWLAGDDTFENWTHRSQHPDTSLDHYWTGEASVGYAIAELADATIRLHTGFEYTDVQWTGYGGSYIYSTMGFRDDVGNFPDGERGITYRQQLPEIFFGADGEQYYGNVRIGGLLRGGVTLFSVATDDHWMRDLRFIDSILWAPTFEAGVDVGVKLTDFAELVVAARYDHVFQGRGETQVYDTTTGTLVNVSPDSGAAELMSAEFSGGIIGRF